MDRMNFTHAVARLRVIEKRLLDKMKIERMIESSSLDEAIKILQETQYGDNISLLKRNEDYELLLNEELKRLYSLMYEISPEKLIVDIMSIKYDYHNIKVLKKSEILGGDLSSLLIPIGTVEIDKLKNSIVTNELKELEPIMREAIVEVQKNYEENKDSQSVDIILDNYMYKATIEKAKESNFDFIVDFIRKSIDLTNIKTMIRVKTQNKDIRFLESVLLDNGNIPKEFFIQGLNDNLESFSNRISKYGYETVLKALMEEYSSSGKYNSLEVYSDNYLMSFIKNAKRINFGPEPIIAYIIAKETEIKIIRIILAGKLNKVDSNIIRERLRDVYA